VVETLLSNELQRGWHGAVLEQRLARPDDDGEDPPAVLVDQVVAHQRPGQVPAAVHLELWSICLLQLRDPFGRVALD